MINALERLSSDLHEARAEFFRRIHYVELTEEGKQVVIDVGSCLDDVLDCIEEVLLLEGSE